MVINLTTILLLFFLGYDRSVPGMPRLQIVGDVTKGEHNLHLYRVQLSDSGEYECQVQPVDIHPLLRRRTTLHVTNLPSPPVITYKNKVPTNNEIIIDSNDDINKSLSLTCVSKEGVPQPVFQWTWNSRSLGSMLVTDIRIRQDNADNSILHIPVAFFKSGHTVSCSVKNKATELSESGNENFYLKYEAKMRIILFTRPGRPQIEFFSQMHFIEFNEGANLELTCSLKPVGKPNANLTWQSESFAKSDISNHQTTILDKNEERLLTKLMIKNISRNHHYSNLTCVSNHPLMTKETPSVTLIIKHRPRRLHISRISQPLSQHALETNIIKETSTSLVIDGMENDNVNIACVTSSYFGKIKMGWQLEYGKDFDGSRRVTQIMSPLEKRDYANAVNFTVNTVITQIVKLKRTFNSGEVLCHATTEDNHIINTHAYFNVFYLPKVSVISGYVSQFPLHEGDMIQLSCCAYGGNPTPRLRWFQNNKIMLEKSGNISKTEEQTLVFVSRVFRRDNGQQLFCEASSDSIISKTIRSNHITINVVFPPSQLSLSCENCQSEMAISNVTTHFLCETTSSNPGSFIVWRILNCSVIRKQNSTKCSSSVLEGSMATNVPGAYNGWRSQSRLNIQLNYRHHGLFLDCESTLSHKMFPDRYKSLNKRITLQILYPPVLLNVNTHSTLVIDEDNHFSVASKSMKR